LHVPFLPRFPCCYQLVFSSVVTFNFWVMGSLLEDYAVWFFAFAFFASLIGGVLLAFLVKKYNRYFSFFSCLVLRVLLLPYLFLSQVF
jgi:hypothetical protein